MSSQPRDEQARQRRAGGRPAGRAGAGLVRCPARRASRPGGRRAVRRGGRPGARPGRRAVAARVVEPAGSARSAGPSTPCSATTRRSSSTSSTPSTTWHRRSASLVRPPGEPGAPDEAPPRTGRAAADGAQPAGRTRPGPTSRPVVVDPDPGNAPDDDWDDLIDLDDMHDLDDVDDVDAGPGETPRPDRDAAEGNH
nr:hypothetical protein [Angustibacter aerolatus]